MHLDKQFLSRFLGSGALFMVGIPIGLFTNIVIARTLSVEDFGLYSFLLSTVGLLTIPVAIGLPQLLTRETARYTHNSRLDLFVGLKRASLLWWGGSSAIVICAVLLLQGQFSEDPRWGYLPYAIALLPLMSIDTMRCGMMEGLGQPFYGKLPIQIIQPVLLMTMVIVGAWAFELSLPTILLIQVSAWIFTNIAGKFLLHKHLPTIPADITPSYTFKLWLSALGPFTVINVMGLLLSQVGVFMLGIMSEESSVAAFRIGERGAQMLMLCVTLSDMAIAAQIVKLHQAGDKEGMQKLVTLATRVSTLIAAIGALIFTLLGEWLVTVTFGEKYVEIAMTPLLIMVYTQLFNVSVGSVGVILNMTGHEKVTMRGQFIAVALMISTSYILIPEYHAVGAAIGNMVGFVVWNIWLGWAVIKRLSIRPGIL